MDSRQRERYDSMIFSRNGGTRNVNNFFYESEAWRIAALNEIFGEMELTAAEEKRRNNRSVRRTEKLPAGRKGSFDGRNGCRKLLRYSTKVTKLMRRIRR